MRDLLSRLAAFTFFVGLAQAQEPAGVAGKISHDIWRNIQGVDLESLWNHPGFYQAGDVQGQRDDLESAVNIGNSFGQRLRGYLIAPITGEYRFSLSGDDHAALWLSDSDDKFAKKKLIHLRGYTASHQVGRYRAQLSDPVQLTAGERYYIEVQHKEGSGGDHVSVSWSYAEGNGLINWAREAGAVASQSSTGWGGVASRAIDGNTSGTYASDSITHTLNSPGEWWQVDLGADRQIDRLELFNRNLDGIRPASCLTNFRLSILDSSGNIVTSRDFHTNGTNVLAFDLWETGGVVGRAVKVERLGPSAYGENFLTLAEVHVLGRSDPAAAYQAFEVVPGSALETYAGSLNDADDDGFPDDWENQNGFNLTSSEGGDYLPAADPDQDGFTNLTESILGTASFQGDSVPGYLTVELWTAINGSNVSDLVASDSFFDQPQTRQAVTSTSLGHVANHTGRRLRGYITAPESGTYYFWVSSRNGSELWLSDDASKYRKQRLAIMGAEFGTEQGIPSTDNNLWDRFSCQMSEGIQLEAGQKYFIEALNKQSYGNGSHVSLAWARPGKEREALPLSVVSSYAIGPEDADDDYLPDAWESQYGLSLTDNGALDRDREGERADYDFDGLSNREEYILGTDPTNPDTDGDGLSDSEEHRSYGTDPTQSDAPSEQLVGTVDLANFTDTGLSWTMTSEGLIPASFRGGIRWDFNVPANGYWSLNIATRLLGDLYQHEVVNFEVLIDGVSLGKRALVFGVNRDALLRIITPLLTSGNHTLELKIDNMLARRMVSIRSIQILDPQGADLDGDGYPDWITSSLTGANTLEPYSSLSRISPAFLEGSARSRSTSTLNGQALSKGLDHDHWYANLPLASTGRTSFDLTFGDGLIESGNIQWQATNVLENETLIIRKGDSLKLTAIPASGATGQDATLSIPLNTNWALEAGATASQSSTNWKREASRAIDGNTNGVVRNRSVTATKNISGSWWQVDLAQDRPVNRVSLWNRGGDSGIRLSNYRVSILDSTGSTVASKDFHTHNGYTKHKEDWYLPSTVLGRVVKVELLGVNRAGDYILALAEVQVFEDQLTHPVADTSHYLHQFATPGTHQVHATHSDGTTGQLTVHVKQADFSSVPQDFVSNITHHVKVSALTVDQDLHFEGGDAFSVTGDPSQSGHFFSLRATPRERGVHHMIARLHPGGPILGAKPLNFIGISGALQNDLASTFFSRDFSGYNVLTTPIVATDLPAGATISVRIFRSGVTFLDGTKVMTLSASDFVNGVISIDFLFPIGMTGGYCHHLDIYDRNGAFIARR